jgi:hypothetical protein
MAGAGTAAGARRSGPDLLGIYLNDHLAGATGGLELARRVAGSHCGPAADGALQRLAAEVAQDRTALQDIMDALGIPVRAYKVYAAWIGEKAARLKLNGHLLARSPLSSLEELEMLRLGVEGKAAGWRTLGVLAGWMSSSPGPSARPNFWRSCASAPRARSSASGRQTAAHE